MRSVDLNADLGESWERWRSGADRELLDVVTSANVCCGAYAGDEQLMAETCRAAVEHGVAIGAQIGYRDREGFGRRDVELDTAALMRELSTQLRLLHDIATDAGGNVAYVKPHGALYNRIVHDPQHALAVVDAIGEVGPWRLLGLPGAVALDLAQSRGLDVRLEGFADRAYTPDGALLPRSEPGAVLSLPTDASAQAVDLAARVDSICLHSDSPGAVGIAREVRAALESAGMDVTAPW